MEISVQNRSGNGHGGNEGLLHRDGLSYRLSDGTVNTIGLIGPTRMQYGKVLSVLGEVGKSITELLDGQNENHEKQEK